jgi:tetratricopeptide (TPR) repeat protein
MYWLRRSCAGIGSYFPYHLSPVSRCYNVAMVSPSLVPNEWTRFAPPPRPLSGADKWNVFLSYRSLNRAWVLNLYDILRQHGYSVFIDQCVLRAGDELTLRLQEALTTSQAGVLIWSATTGDSDWVAREYQVLDRMATTKAGFRFVPVRLDSSEPPPFVANRIFLDFSSYPDGPNGGELLRLLHALVGLPLSADAAAFAVKQDEAATEASTKIGSAVGNGDAERLVKLFDQGGLVWQTSSSLGCQAIEGLTKLGRNDDAIALLQKLMDRFPKAIRPKQLYALALARRAQGTDLSDAQEILGELYQQGERDPETLGIYARTWMDRFSKSGDVRELKRSRGLYAEAFERAPDDYYTGINAAAKSVFLGTEDDLKKASEYAARVQTIVGTEPRASNYWMTATVGEVFLIQKNYSEAARLYDAAVTMAPTERGNHLTTWTQSCRLMSKLQPTVQERAMIRQVFSDLPDCDQLPR